MEMYSLSGVLIEAIPEINKFFQIRNLYTVLKKKAYIVEWGPNAKVAET